MKAELINAPINTFTISLANLSPSLLLGTTLSFLSHIHSPQASLCYTPNSTHKITLSLLLSGSAYTLHTHIFIISVSAHYTPTLYCLQYTHTYMLYALFLSLYTQTQGGSSNELLSPSLYSCSHYFLCRFNFGKNQFYCSCSLSLQRILELLETTLLL